MHKFRTALLLSFLPLLFACKGTNTEAVVHDTIYLSRQNSRQDLPEGFCYLTDTVPDVLLEIRYYSDFNFVGRRIEGYDAPLAICTSQAACALRKANEELRQHGFLLKIYDAYRPQCAVNMFQTWASDLNDTSMRRYFYPEISKNDIRPQGYIARKSAHSRGSAVDVTIVEMRSGAEADMGSPFDYFGPISRPDCNSITPQQKEHRKILQQAMLHQGFCQNPHEWWHFTLRNEPFPNTYFNFRIQ